MRFGQYYNARFTHKWLKQQNGENFKKIYGTDYLPILSCMPSYQYIMHTYIHPSVNGLNIYTLTMELHQKPKLICVGEEQRRADMI